MGEGSDLDAGVGGRPGGRREAGIIVDEREGRVMGGEDELELIGKGWIDDEGEIEDALNIWQTGYEHAMTLVGEWQR